MGLVLKEFLFLMHDDASNPAYADDGARWAEYLDVLSATGRFDGGSSAGAGACVRKGHADRPLSVAITGFLRVRAEDFEGARDLLRGNPVYEAGGTVEIRELVPD
jgi:hypothetical protein